MSEELTERLAAAIDAEWTRPEHACGGDGDACQQTCPMPAYLRMGLEELRDSAAAALVPLIREREAAAWDSAVQAVAWLLDNGEPSASAALAYAAKNNPYVGEGVR